MTRTAGCDPPEIDSILSLLRSSQDERKLAGLLLVTRVVIGQKWDVGVLSRLADAVGSTFLRRLLRSTDHDGVYVDLAIDIIAVFMASPDVPKRYAEEGICKEIMACRKGVLSPDLLDLYTSFINAGDCSPLSLLTTIWETGADDTLRSVVGAWIRPEYARQILFGPQSAIMTALATDLKSRQDLRKFAALEFVVSILSQLHPFDACRDDADGCSDSWPVAIRDGLTEILTSRVNAQQRRLALMASYFLLDLFGYSWALSGESICERFPTLLVTTVAIETRVLLECHAERPAADDDIETLQMCMIITNKVISFLVDDDDSVIDSSSQFHWSLLSPESLLIIQSRLTEIIRAIFGFLAECESQERVSDPIMPHALLVLVAWISEDSESFQSDLERSCDFLIRLRDESKDDVGPLVCDLLSCRPGLSWPEMAAPL